MLITIKCQAELEGRHSQARAWERDKEAHRRRLMGFVPQPILLRFFNPTNPPITILFYDSGIFIIHNMYLLI
jgi:hypothetical protein